MKVPSSTVVCAPLGTQSVPPVNMLYMGQTTIQLGNDAFTFGATELTGNTLLTVAALAALGIGLWLFHSRK
jgi:hypothetical protein